MQEVSPLGILDNIYHWPGSTDFGEAQGEVEQTILKALKLWEINSDIINFAFNLHWGAVILILDILNLPQETSEITNWKQ